MTPESEREWPGVSVVMPVLNEERHLEAAVRRVQDQDYPGPLEVLLVVGPGGDRSEQIAADLAAADPRVRVVPTPRRAPRTRSISASRRPRTTSSSGSTATASSRTAISSGQCSCWSETGAANVGGVMDAQGDTPFEQAVATAYTTRLGLGGAAFHLTDAPAGEAETVFLGVFRKEAVLAVGGFDETMHRAQDWELNYRLRRGGRRIWFSPELRVTYRPRSTLRALIRQMYDTGQWRREVVRRHPETASPRYLAPPVAVLGLTGGTVLGAVGLITGSRLLTAGFLAPLGYLILVVAGAVTAPEGTSAAARVRLPLVLAATHLSWGTGFLLGRRR